MAAATGNFAKQELFSQIGAIRSTVPSAKLPNTSPTPRFDLG